MAPLYQVSRYLRQRRLRVYRGTAASLRLGEQGRVVRFRGIESVGTDDLVARIVPIAVTPRSRRRRIVTDQRDLVCAPDLLQADRRVATVVARIGPERLVEVKILGREDVHRQRRDTRRRRTVARRENRCVAFGDAGTGVKTLAFGADDDLGDQRIGRAAAAALLAPHS